MKRILLSILLLSSAAGSRASYALEDHRPYRGFKFTECNECHRDSGVLPTHQAGWNSDHRMKVLVTTANCDSCHDQAFCMECHAGGGIDASLHVSYAKRAPDALPRNHRSGFREIHPVSAFDNPASCDRCHRPSFCKECHDRFQPPDLMFLSHRKGWSDRRAVPGGPKHSTFPPESCLNCHPGSVLPTHEWAGAHAREAKRNLASCQACHPDGDICLKCHGAKSGLRVNPHPDNWGSFKDKLNRAAGQRTCVKCH